MGGNVDRDINKGGGPFIFRMSGQNYHLHGTVLPRDEEIPKFAQLYIVDTGNEISNRYVALSSKNEDSPKAIKEIDRSIAVQIKEILNSYNTLVKDYRAIGEQIDSNNASTVKIILISRKESDADKNKEKLGKNYDLPTANEYPLLFPYTEDGYRDDIFLKGFEDKTEDESPAKVSDETWVELSEDIQTMRRAELNIPDHVISDEEKKNCALLLINEMLLTRGVKLEEIPYMPRPDLTNKDDWTNILIQEELNIDKELLVKEHTSLMSSMTNEQRGVYDTLTLTNETQNICVKIDRMWKERAFRKRSWFENLEFILIDEEGHRIHASVASEFINSFGKILIESNYVYISNFDVHEYKCKTKYTNHMYKIDFNKNTRVKECSSFEVGYNRFHFVEFDKLLNHHVEDKTCINLIGFLSGCYDIEDTEINGHPKMKLDCNIMDLNRNRLYCTLYGEHAWQLGFYMSCSDCNRKVTNMNNVIGVAPNTADFITINNNLWCKICKVNPKIVLPRFRLHARVADVSGRTAFIMFDREVSRLINMNAQQLLEIQKHIAVINTFPQIFGKFVGRKFAFKVEIPDYNIEGIHAEDEHAESVEEEQVEPTSLTGTKLLEEQEFHNSMNNSRLSILTRIADKIPMRADKSDDQNGQVNIGSSEEEARAKWEKNYQNIWNLRPVDSDRKDVKREKFESDKGEGADKKDIGRFADASIVDVEEKETKKRKHPYDEPIDEMDPYLLRSIVEECNHCEFSYCSPPTP
ncbi:hypothetical protein CTI12_AA416340 [Artemisia annua]|uniref:Replication protein A 70 kDa DNA-binding subunit B n=1 Tax=Artemisia annua TaxID=35608 RepID=A0A2U1M5Z9_ARTAN|nr:hypothetical protein CTI12_AA416340 [Artemisia annua]